MTDPTTIAEVAKGIDMGQLLSWIATAIIAGYVAWQKFRDKKIRRRFNLQENPRSCADHEHRLRSIEKDIGSIQGDIKAIKVKIELE